MAKGSIGSKLPVIHGNLANSPLNPYLNTANSPLDPYRHNAMQQAQMDQHNALYRGNPLQGQMWPPWVQPDPPREPPEPPAPPVYDPFKPLTTGDDEMADKQQKAPVVFTPIGVLAFNNLYEARPVVEGGEARFSATLIFDEDVQKTEAYQNLTKAIMAEAHRFFGDKLPKDIRWPIRDGEEKEEFEGFGAGKKFINPWTKLAVGVIGPKKEKMVQSDVFSGVLARFAVRPRGYNTAGNKGVLLMLEGVQVADTNQKRIDGKTDASRLFDDLEGFGGDGGDDDLPF